MGIGRGARVAGSVLVVLLALGAAAWWFRDSLPLPWGQTAYEATEISPEAAAAAERKLERLQSGGEAVRLSEVELASLLRYRTPVWAAGMVNQPAIELSGDTLRVSGLVPTDRLPSHPELDRVRAFLPDSSRVDLVGLLIPLEQGRVAVDVAEVSFAGVPIPSRYYPAVLRRIGRKDEPGLPPTALAVQLPDGVGSARIEDGYLVLTP